MKHAPNDRRSVFWVLRECWPYTDPDRDGRSAARMPTSNMTIIICERECKLWGICKKRLRANFAGTCWHHTLPCSQIINSQNLCIKSRDPDLVELESDRNFVNIWKFREKIDIERTKSIPEKDYIIFTDSRRSMENLNNASLLQKKVYQWHGEEIKLHNQCT